MIHTNWLSADVSELWRFELFVIIIDILNVNKYLKYHWSLMVSLASLVREEYKNSWDIILMPNQASNSLYGFG